MSNRVLLAILTALGSAMCWFPLGVEPNLELSAWTPLACAAVCTGIATSLTSGPWLLFPLASGIGVFCGLVFTYTIWPPSDPIARPWVPYAVAVETTLTVLISLLAALAGRNLLLSPIYRKAAWVALFCFVGFGPVALALTPPLVEQRVARNDRLAAMRFSALKAAVERTAAEGSSPVRICDGSALKSHYAGPPFSEEDWRRITGNYVQQDGYVFMVYCREQNGYTIDAWPSKVRGHGTRQFCADESGKVGCRTEWNRSRRECLPCQK